MSSSHDKCEPSRKVKIYFRQPGADDLRGKGETDGAGEWSIVIVLVTDGDYYAKVKRLNIGPSGHKHICRPAKSDDHAYPDHGLIARL